ncbi:hypothetical protein V2J09_009800 [Rumex salicifolius]
MARCAKKKVVQKKELTNAVEENHKENKAKGRKRKETEKKKEQEQIEAEVKLQEEAEIAPKKVEGRGKRAKISKPEVEPEYFSDKRRLEDLWKEVFPVGTEWDQLDSVYQYNWKFTNLEDAFEEGGELHGKRVYLFGCTEPQMVPFKDGQKIICIPVVVAVASPFPPSDKIGINSVQRETEEIVPMKSMKMDWVPYIPLDHRESQVERLKTEIFILACTQRRTALKHMKEDRLKKFEYCLPYFYNPLMEEEEEQSTIVQILYPIDPKPEFTDKLIEEEELEVEKKDDFKEHLKKSVREQKKANREAREARKKAREEMSDTQKAAFENMKFYKFYPVASPDSPDVSNVKAPFINRYYGKAYKIL